MAASTKSQFNVESDPVLQYLYRWGLREHPELAALREYTVKNHPRARMISSPEEQQLLALLCKMINAKVLVDVGVFTGYSTLSAALASPPDAKVIALDVSTEYTAIGEEYWKRAGVRDKIDLRIGPAAEALQAMVDKGETIDYMFIDADKNNYDVYYELGLSLMRPGGIIAVDNVLWGGAVADESVQDEDTVAIRKLNEKMHGDSRIDLSFLQIADGVAICRKR